MNLGRKKESDLKDGGRTEGECGVGDPIAEEEIGREIRMDLPLQALEARIQLLHRRRRRNSSGDRRPTLRSDPDRAVATLDRLR